MGQNILYFHTGNNEQQSLKALLIEHFATFRQWTLRSEEPFVDSEVLMHYLEQHTYLPEDFEHLDKELLDALVAEFIMYCESFTHTQHLLELLDPFVKKRYYESSTQMVLATHDDLFIRLWSYIVQGRSFKDDQAFDGDYKVGFLTQTQCQLLREKIETYFGNRQTIRNQAWTQEELELFQKSPQRGVNLHPKGLGLECALVAIESALYNKKELIIAIE